ncbi:endolytic transglycosylase MltG [Neisseriaceae bacterium PsAf]|nr:endolytic transglycosylase MltG [Neisseriaceae bacterium PsAf]MCV2502642.1 endolytic transglycosylase MltG [Neisseriaceae bacterium]
MKIDQNKRVIAGLVIIPTLIILIIFIVQMLFYPKNLHQDEYLLVINKGDSVSSVATKLKQEGIIYTREGFILLAKIKQLNSKIKPGFFHIKDPSSSWDIVRIIENEPEKITITFIEGWNYQQIKYSLDANNRIRHLTKDWTEQQLLEFLDKNTSYTSIEGLLLPDSFYFYEGVEDKDIYKMAYSLMQKELKKQWEERQEGLPYKTPYELLIMASIIEKETGHVDDRGLVSSVFVNRLKKGMRLQTDPSVIYGMGGAYQGKISKKDLYQDTPYNTYTRSGLPPTPIAMPSRASLYAAAHPADEEYLYFVSKQDGTGKSYFSKSLPEHNAAVRKYILGK